MEEEEKKAIEDMNRFANGIDMSCVTARQMQIILNLVEKLQKENKELKNDISNMYDEEVVISIMCDEFNLSKNETLRVLRGE